MWSDFCLTDRSIDWVVQSFNYFMVFFLVSGQSFVTVTSSCASLLTIETRTAGLIYSNYNGTYLDHMNCNWTISSNAKLELAFIRFQTESGYDFVKVYDGPTSSSTLIGEYDGDSLPTLITSSSHELFITFTTDQSVIKSGFLAHYHGKYQLVSIKGSSWPGISFPKFVKAVRNVRNSGPCFMFSSWTRPYGTHPNQISSCTNWDNTDKQSIIYHTIISYTLLHPCLYNFHLLAFIVMVLQ